MNAALVRNNFLFPAMEAIAHNIRQFDDSPEVDSILEQLRVRVSTAIVEPELRDELLGLVEECIDSNRLEGVETKSVAKVADEVSADLHRRETAGVSKSLSADAIARALRDHCKIVRTPAGRTAKELTRSHLAIKQVFDDVPIAQVTAQAVLHQLGAKNSEIVLTYAEAMVAQ